MTIISNIIRLIRWCFKSLSIKERRNLAFSREKFFISDQYWSRLKFFSPLTKTSQDLAAIYECVSNWEDKRKKSTDFVSRFLIFNYADFLIFINVNKTIFFYIVWIWYWQYTWMLLPATQLDGQKKYDSRCLIRLFQKIIIPVQIFFLFYRVHSIIRRENFLICTHLSNVDLRMFLEITIHFMNENRPRKYVRKWVLNFFFTFISESSSTMPRNVGHCPWIDLFSGFSKFFVYEFELVDLLILVRSTLRVQIKLALLPSYSPIGSYPSSLIRFP